jgi:lysozyme family protein
MIQRTLGVKVDGIMGTKSMAALEAMKQHRLVLDLPTKTLTELEESKPLLQLMDKEVSAQIMALKASYY